MVTKVMEEISYTEEIDQWPFSIPILYKFTSKVVKSVKPMKN